MTFKIKAQDFILFIYFKVIVFDTCALRGWNQGAYLGLQDPVRLRFEGLDLVVALHTEAQRRGLARAERDQGRVQVAVLTLEVLGLEPE